MVTLKFREEDLPFVMTAIRDQYHRMMEGLTTQLQIQQEISKPGQEEKFPPQEVRVDTPPVEVTITPRRGPGRPKGVKNKTGGRK